MYNLRNLDFDRIVPGKLIGNNDRHRPDPLLSMDNGNTTNTNSIMISETALDWFDRCQKHGVRKRRRSATGSSRNNENESSETTDVHASSNPSMAAWRFLRFGQSGIAPIDAAWKRSNDGRSESSSFLPPVTVLEGPKDVGKTWMLLTLAARFVVATRASRFQDFQSMCGSDDKKNYEPYSKNKSQTKGLDGDGDTDEEGSSNRSNEDRPKVLLLDSTYDFSVPQLVAVIRLTLVRERQRERQRSRRTNQRGRQSEGGRQSSANNNNEISDNVNGGYSEDKHNYYRQKPQQQTVEEELERQEKEKLCMEQDIEDCLSRIHIIQVDNGPTGWVSMLEAITYQLSEHRHHCNRCNNNANNSIRSGGSIEIFPARPPTLLLWDGFLSDMALSTNAMMAQKITSVVLSESVSNNNNSQFLFDSPSTQELLIQLSRLLQKEPDALWLVLTTRTITVPGTVTSPAKINDTASADTLYTPTTTEQSGIGLRLTEWIRKEEEKRRREKDSRERSRQPLMTRYTPSQQSKEQQQSRATYRIRLDRRRDDRVMGDEQHIPSTAAAAAALFAKVVGSPCGGTTGVTFGPNSDGTDASNRNNEKIPYSVSIGGILS